MSSKAEKTSHSLHEQPRSSIFFRNPALLKIVAWLGSLSFLGTTGIVWADLQPISTARTEDQASLQSSSSPKILDRQNSDIYGPQFPTAAANASGLPNREVPTAVAPASVTILPTGTIARPQHTDLLTADNYTVNVNGSSTNNSQRGFAEEFIEIPVPAPLRTTIPRANAEVLTTNKSQVRPHYLDRQATVSQSVPATSLKPQVRERQSAPNYTAVPVVSSIPTVTSGSPQLGRGSANIVSSGLRSAVVAPLRTPASNLNSLQSTSPTSIPIVVSSPRTQTIAVQPVAQLPQISSVRAIPIVPAIPSVRSGNVSQPKSMAFASNGTNEFSSELIYPLSSPAPTTSSFGWRTHPITGSRRFHSGVDIGAPMGAPVVAAGSGTIISAGWVGGYGKAIVIQHNGVQQTLYGHLSEVFVQVGQRIEQGTVIGRVGSTGNSTGPHLHFEARVSTADGWVAIDPGEDIKYALDNLQRAMPFAQRDLPPGIN
jgi:murein DD-endopeptidase MepM/ murein hydrolase activator NlpD